MLQTSQDPLSPGRVIVDLGAIAENLEVLRSFAPGVAQMAVVKADAYGHGLLPVAMAALQAGATWLGVAQLAEARALREGLDAAGIDRSAAPILAWVAPSGADWAGALEAGIDLSVSWTWVLAEICAAARVTGIRARIHVKIDTGMSRAGSTRADLPALVAAVRMAEEDGLIEVVGAWSHLSRGDDLSEDGRASTAAQVEVFEQGLRSLADAGIEPRIRHLSATSGILWHPEAHYDMVRAGIGMYGLSPDPLTARGAALGLRPAMTLRAPLTSVKVVEDGAPASYGGTWRAPGRRWLGPWATPMGSCAQDRMGRRSSSKGERRLRPGSPVGSAWISSSSISVPPRASRGRRAHDRGGPPRGSAIPRPSSATPTGGRRAQTSGRKPPERSTMKS